MVAAATTRQLAAKLNVSASSGASVNERDKYVCHVFYSSHVSHVYTTNVKNLPAGSGLFECCPMYQCSESGVYLEQSFHKYHRFVASMS